MEYLISKLKQIGSGVNPQTTIIGTNGGAEIALRDVFIIIILSTKKRKMIGDRIK